MPGDRLPPLDQEALGLQVGSEIGQNAIAPSSQPQIQPRFRPILQPSTQDRSKRQSLYRQLPHLQRCIQIQRLQSPAQTAPEVAHPPQLHRRRP